MTPPTTPTANDIVRRAAGIAEDDPLAGVLQARGDILEMTEAAHDAALRPADPGGISHGERAALATRVALLNREAELAERYRAMLAGTDPAHPLADPNFDGGGDARLGAILAYMDRVAAAPREASAADVTAMQAAGVADADIVRVSQLNAFLAYQIRLIAGLRLMRDRQ
jgi:uncharacterized protein YciW